MVCRQGLGFLNEDQAGSLRVISRSEQPESCLLDLQSHTHSRSSKHSIGQLLDPLPLEPLLPIILRFKEAKLKYFQIGHCEI